MGLRKVAVLTTAILFIVGFTWLSLRAVDEPLRTHSVDVAGQPTLGNGPVQLVVFEDLLCLACREFHEEIFPKIQSNYIDQNQASYTLILISYVEGSFLPTNAALFVYHKAPDRFFPFIKEVFSREVETIEEIFSAAETVGGIDLTGLQEAIEQGSYFHELERNFALAQEAMGDQFRTPALFVSGAMTSTSSFGAIQKRMEEGA